MSYKEKRLEAYRALGAGYGLDAEALENSGDEAYRLVLDGDEPCERYAVVSSSAEFVYITTVRSLPAAKRKAVEFAGDSSFGQTPVAIVDLHTGMTYEPKWETLKWWSHPVSS